MNSITIPKSVKDAISASVACMCATLAIPQARIDGALNALFDELNGKGTRSVTNCEPLDRSISRKQAAEILGRTVVTISRMVRDGKLRAIYGGRDGLRLTGISEKSVRDFMSK